MKIRSIDKDIRDILESGFYRIPRFQRPYSWDRENIEDFWNDVIINSDADYFIGGMVVFKPPSSDTAGVVDGQQRLTTITMILAALRNAFKDEGFPDLAGGVHRLVERFDINNKAQFVLQTETSYPYLQEFIQKDGPPHTKPEIGEEEEKLKASFDYITSQITQTVQGLKQNKTLKVKEIEAKIKDALTGIRDRILALKVIYIDLDNEDDAYLIFETLNTRGKDLTPSDLVKSHLTKLLKPSNKNVDITKDTWQKMGELIEGSPADLSVTTYLHHYWLSKYEYVTVKNLYKDLKRKVSKENAKDFLDSLAKDAQIYREIQETSYRKWKKEERAIRESLDALDLFRVKQPLPMVLAIMHDYEAGHIKQKHVEEILAVIENFHFIFTAITSQRSSGGISMMYALHARGLHKASDLQAKLKVLSEFKAKLKGKAPTAAEFEPAFLNLRYSRSFTKQRKLIRYILAKIDRQYASGVTLDYQQMNIEHLSPLNPPTNKADIQADNIGNLILTEPKFNEKLGNKPFAQKIVLLKGSKVFLDPVLSAAVAWTAKDVQTRAKWLAKNAYEKVWKV